MNIKTFLEKRGLTIEQFKEYAKGWYGIVQPIELQRVDRYALYCDKPFYLLNQKYNEEYKKNPDIGSTYDWLNEIVTDEEIDEYLKTI